MDAPERTLRGRLIEAFAHAPDQPLPDDTFDHLARDIFAWQFERNPPFAAYCRRRDATPDRIRHWTDIPAVPTAAFKEVDLVAGDPRDAQAVFRTSGTTAGRERRGTHHVLDVSLYHAALLPAFRAWVVPDDARLRMLSLMPSASELPDSSLAHMIDTIVAHLGAPGSGHFATVSAGLDDESLERAIGAATEAGESVCVLGTSLSYAHWLDRLAERDRQQPLPPGSRLMDTGGFKGSSREVSADELRRMYTDRLGVSERACINEYGMTEMTSQFYDSTLRRDGHRRKIAPPWVRTRVVHPDTLQPVVAGPGLLQHFDLANLHSVIAIQTEDLGIAVDDGFEVLGRAAGATPRGCSIAMDLLLGGVGT